MQHQAEISRTRLAERVGSTCEILVDAVDEEGTGIGRTYAEAPEIDGVVRIADAFELEPGDLLTAEITDADDHDLFVEPPL